VPYPAQSRSVVLHLLDCPRSPIGLSSFTYCTVLVVSCSPSGFQHPFVPCHPPRRVPIFLPPPPSPPPLTPVGGISGQHCHGAALCPGQGGPVRRRGGRGGPHRVRACDFCGPHLPCPAHACREPGACQGLHCHEPCQRSGREPHVTRCECVAGEGCVPPCAAIVDMAELCPWIRGNVCEASWKFMYM
jgi:hypothetical protein